MRTRFLLPVLALVAFFAGCASSGGSSARADGRALRVTFVDYRTSQRLELVNEAHTSRLEQYSEIRNDAMRKVQSDEVMGALVDYLYDEGFAERATPGPMTPGGGGRLLWGLEIVEGDGEPSHVTETKGLTAAEKQDLRQLSFAFLSTYNATYGAQAVEVQAGQSPFKAPERPTRR